MSAKSKAFMIGIAVGIGVHYAYVMNTGGRTMGGNA